MYYEWMRVCVYFYRNVSDFANQNGSIICECMFGYIIPILYICINVHVYITINIVKAMFLDWNVCVHICMKDVYIITNNTLMKSVIKKTL